VAQLTQHPRRATRPLIHELLQDVGKRRGELVILTGERGSGKTTWCQAFHQGALEQRLAPRGLVSPGIFRDNVKVNIDLIDLSNNRRRRLAGKRAEGQPGDEEKPATQTWLFDPETLAWGERCLKEILDSDEDLIEVLIIDEMGPLEFEQHVGWVSGLALIDRRQYHLACISIRPELLEKARQRWSWGAVVETVHGGEE
jgi:nucleoside-triphosphatase THEP1